MAYSFTRAVRARGHAVPTTLPKPIAAYFEAVNGRNVQAFVRVLATHAIVRDEGREHMGPEPIRRWLEEAIRKYDVTVAPTRLERAREATIVTATVSGNFPGSPLSLRHAFHLAGGRVSRLEIG